MRHDPDGPLLILAPHPDDAVLSAWASLRTPGEVVVMTVCAGVPPEGSLGAFDAVFAVTDSAARLRTRRGEDRAALALAGREARHLDLLDDQYRAEPLDVDTLVELIGSQVAVASALLGPAGIGGHPDHLAVRAAAVALHRAAGVPLRVFADFPYAVNMGWPSWVTGLPPRPHLAPEARWSSALAELAEVGAYEPVVHRLGPDEARAKLAALRCYHSQFAALEGGPLQRVSHPEILGFEVSWSVGSA